MKIVNRGRRKSDMFFYSIYFILAFLYCFTVIKLVPVSPNINILLIFIFLLINTIYKFKIIKD